MEYERVLTDEERNAAHTAGIGGPSGLGAIPSGHPRQSMPLAPPMASPAADMAQLLARTRQMDETNRRALADTMQRALQTAQAANQAVQAQQTAMEARRQAVHQQVAAAQQSRRQERLASTFHFL